MEGDLWREIRGRLKQDLFRVSLHAQERLAERRVELWQILDGVEDAEVLEERPASRPHPSVVVRQILADGTEVRVVWSFSARLKDAALVTCFFPGAD